MKERRNTAESVYVRRRPLISERYSKYLPKNFPKLYPSFCSDHGALINRCFYLTIIESVGQKKDLDNMDRGLITLL